MPTSSWISLRNNSVNCTTTTEPDGVRTGPTPQTRLCNVSRHHNKIHFLPSRNSTVLHALFVGMPYHDCYAKKFFFVLLIDTWCSSKSSRGYWQCRAFCRSISESEKVYAEHCVNCRLSISRKTSRHTITIIFGLAISKAMSELT